MWDFVFLWVPPASLVKFELPVPSTIFPPCSREIRHLSQLGHVSRRQFAVYLYRRAPLQPTTSLRTTCCVRLWSWTTVFGFGLCSLVGTRHTRNTLCSVCFFRPPFGRMEFVLGSTRSVPSTCAASLSWFISSETSPERRIFVCVSFVIISRVVGPCSPPWQISCARHFLFCFLCDCYYLFGVYFFACCC